MEGRCNLEFYEVVRTRRSVRSYKPDPIPQEVLDMVLDAARVAPSGSNRQPWKFILVTDEELKRRMISDCGHQDFVAEAPVLAVVCGRNLNYNRGGYMGDLSMLVDVTIAFTHLVLAARAEGLGTCWIGAFNNEAVKKLLRIPEDMNVVAITPLGYPRGKGFSEPGPRKNMAEIASTNKF